LFVKILDVKVQTLHFL